MDSGKVPITLPVLLLILLPTPRSLCAAEAPRISGYINVFDYLDMSGAAADLGLTEHLESGSSVITQDRAGVRLQLRLDGQLGAKVSYDAALNLEYDSSAAARQPTSGPDDGFRVYPREIFADLTDLGPLDLRIGRQYLFWGRFEWGGMLDLLAPWDFGTMAAEKENFRLAVDAIDAKLYLGPVILEAAVLQSFQPNRMDLVLPATLGPLEIPVNQDRAALPPDNIQDLETGLRAILSTSQGEVGLTWYRGWDRNISMHVAVEGDNPFMPDAVRFSPTYHRLQVLGLEAERMVGPVVLQLEAGYNHTEDDSGDDIFIRNRSLSWVGGMTWDPWNSLSISLQYGNTFLLNFDRQADYEALRALGQPDSQIYVARTLQHQGVSRLKLTFTDSFKAQSLLIVKAPDTNFMFLNFIYWDFLDQARLYLGGIFFRGPDGTTFGRLEGETRFFTELKVSF